MLSVNDSVLPLDGSVEVSYEILLMVVMVGLWLYYKRPPNSNSAPMRLVIDQNESQNTGNLIGNGEVISIIQQELKPADNQQNAMKVSRDAVSKCTEEAILSSQTGSRTKKKKSKKKSSDFVSKADGDAPIALEGEWNMVVPRMKRQHRQLKETDSAKRTVNIPPSQRNVVEVNEDEQQNYGYLKNEPKIEVMRRILEHNTGSENLKTSQNYSSCFADGSTGAEECSEATTTRKKKQFSKLGSTGSTTSRLPKLLSKKVGTNYEVEIDCAGGTLKLPHATLEFPRGCIRKKAKLKIALFLKQNTRREDNQTIFVTCALHLWLGSTDIEQKNFKFYTPISIKMVKSVSDISGGAMIQKTSSSKDIAWRFFDKGHCSEEYVSFNTQNLGGYRAISSKHGAMTELLLHYQICVTRSHETDDPDTHIILVKFFTEDMQNFVLEDARKLPGLEVLKSESTRVIAGSLLQLLLMREDQLEEAANFIVPKCQYNNINRTIPIPLNRPPPHNLMLDHHNLLLEMSSPFSDTTKCSFYFKWKKPMLIPSFSINVNASNAIGIQHNHYNI